MGERRADVAAQSGHPLYIMDKGEVARKRAHDAHPDAEVVAELAELDSRLDDWKAAMGIIATWAPSQRVYFDALADRGVTRILCQKPLAHSVSSA